MQLYVLRSRLGVLPPLQENSDDNPYFTMASLWLNPSNENSIPISSNATNSRNSELGSRVNECIKKLFPESLGVQSFGEQLEKYCPQKDITTLTQHIASLYKATLTSQDTFCN